MSVIKRGAGRDPSQMCGLADLELLFSGCYMSSRPYAKLNNTQHLFDLMSYL